MTAARQGRLFDEDDEPAMRTLTRQQLIEAVVAEMKANPPVPSCAGDSPQAARMRKRLAARDVERIYEAAEIYLGATIQIVPIQRDRKKQ